MPKLRSNRLRIILILGLFFCSSLRVWAQNTGDDPLNKPQIWAELVESPLDESLWGRYLAKAYVCMSAREREMITSLKNELMRRKQNPAIKPLTKADEVLLFESSSSNTKKSTLPSQLEQNQKQLKLAYISDIEKFIVREPLCLIKLKASPIENFWIIDDTYRSEFEALGIPYQSFKEVYPDGSGNKLAWIKLKERELISAKRELFEKIRSQVSGN